MTTQTEALKLADRLLDFASEVSADFDTTTLEKASDELRRLDSALAQPEQEPVARLHITETDTYPDVDVEVLDGAMLQPSMSPVNVYTTPPQRKPLTDEEIERLRIEQEFDQWAISEGAFKYAARAIEAAHGIKEKNT